MTQLACPDCRHPISAQQALERGTFSWPEMLGWWSACPHCEKGNHFRAERDLVAQFEFHSAGNWEDTSVLSVPGLTVRADPSFLHVWLGKQHFEFPARDSGVVV